MLLSRRERIDNINHNSTLLLSFFCPLSLLFFQKKLECNPRLAVFIFVGGVWCCLAKATHQFSHSLPISCSRGGEREINKYEKLKEKKYVREVWANLSVLICFLYCSDMFPDLENSIKIMCQKKLKCYSLKWEKKIQWLLLCGQLPDFIQWKVAFQ